MKRFLDACGHHRANLCLLAADALPDAAKVAVKNHLDACESCQQYYDEIKSVTVLLANWGTNYSHIKPDTALQNRWARDIQPLRKPVQSARFAFIIFILGWCHDMIWPCRRIWTGFAATWLTIFAINNFSLRDSSQTLAARSSHPSLELVRAYLNSEGLTVESNRPEKPRVAVPPKTSTPPPRTERHPRILNS